MCKKNEFDQLLCLFYNYDVMFKKLKKIPFNVNFELLMNKFNIKYKNSVSC